MKLNLQAVRLAADAMRLPNGARQSVNGLYSTVGVDSLIATEINFSSTKALPLADFEGLPSNNTMGPVNARPLQVVRKNHGEQTREERPRRFLTIWAPTGQHVKMFKQVRSPPDYPKQVTQEGDIERYGELRFRIDKTIFAAYDKAKMRKAKILVITSSDFVNTSSPFSDPM